MFKVTLSLYRGLKYNYIKIDTYTFMLTYKHRHKLKLHKTVTKCLIQGLFFDVGLVSFAAHLGQNIMSLLCQSVRPSVLPCVNTSVKKCGIFFFVCSLVKWENRFKLTEFNVINAVMIFHDDQSQHATADRLVNWLSLCGGKLTPFRSEINCI